MTIVLGIGYFCLVLLQEDLRISHIRGNQYAFICSATVPHYCFRNSFPGFAMDCHDAVCVAAGWRSVLWKSVLLCPRLEYHSRLNLVCGLIALSIIRKIWLEPKRLPSFDDSMFTGYFALLGLHLVGKFPQEEDRLDAKMLFRSRNPQFNRGLLSFSLLHHTI